MTYRKESIPVVMEYDQWIKVFKRRLKRRLKDMAIDMLIMSFPFFVIIGFITYWIAFGY